MFGLEMGNQRGRYKANAVDAMIGAIFGRLTVLAHAESRREPSGKAVRRLLCRCECGTECVVDAGSLRTGNTSSCGCLRRKTAAETGRRNADRRYTVLAPGQRFGAWTVLSAAHLPGRWTCVCQCGTERDIRVDALPQTKSCGCMNQRNRGRPWTSSRRETVSDAYVCSLFRRQGVVGEVPAEIIETKRDGIRLHRLMREFLQALRSDTDEQKQQDIRTGAQ